MKKILITSLLALAATTSSFGAVKGGKVGVNFQYGSNINSLGAWWHLADIIALNPYVGYSSSSTKDLYTGTAGLGIGCGTGNVCYQTAKSNGFVVGVDVPIYLAKFNALDLFVAPGVGYNSSSSETLNENTTNGQSATVNNGTSTTWNLGLAAGLQIPLLEQLHVFGKAGFDYSRQTKDTYSNYKSTAFTTTRYSVGAIFYFN